MNLKTMLHINTVTGDLISILNILMDSSYFKNFRLCGGTAIALQIGHRKSLDIDLFSNIEFNQNEAEITLKKIFEYVSIEQKVFGTVAYINYTVNSEPIKLDVQFESEPFINKEVNIEGIRIASLVDLAAMKLKAITTRKTKKDFIDINKLLNFLNFKTIVNKFLERYIYNDVKDVIEAFSNIDLADESVEPVMLVTNYSWESCKKQLISEVKKYFNQELTKYLK